MKKLQHARHISAWKFLSALVASVLLSTFFVLSVSAQAAGVKPHSVIVHPKSIIAGNPDASNTFRCQQPTYPVHCYAPQQIRAAYAIQPLLNKGITGKGRTIVIVDAYQSPTVKQDLDLFDTTFGLAAAKLNIIAPDGLTPFDSTDAIQLGWAEEISLDVQWAHAVAPDATIDLVLAKSSNDPDLLSVTKYAVEHNLGDVISQSFGEAESCADPALLKQEHKVFEEATDKHITLFASSGDQGAAQPTCDNSSYILSASTPASDPLVTGVGGTELTADLTTGKYGSEVVLNESAYSLATGGGYSTIYQRPFYQDGTVHSKWRGVPDVAYNGGINGGVLVHLGFPGVPSGFYIFGGTSAGSPQWAAIIALGDQLAGRRLGFINPAIYLIGHSSFFYPYAFHDITSGNNTFAATDANGNPVTINGYAASKGWDPTTGWGTPIVDHLVPLLSIFAHV